MKNALILHGTSANSSSNWFPWLGGELTKRGYECRIPDLPNADEPDLAMYWDYIKDFSFNEDSLIIGHSSGAVAALGIIQKFCDGSFNPKVNKIILVSAFSKDEGWKCEKILCDYDWDKIRSATDEIIQIHSDDDPYVSLDNAKELAKNLEIPIILYPEKGHFNTEYSEEFTKFPEILGWI